MYRKTAALAAICGIITSFHHRTLAADVDGDGVPDALDVCGNTPSGVVVDADGRPQGDMDGDCDFDLLDWSLLGENFTGPIEGDPSTDGIRFVPRGLGPTYAPPSVLLYDSANDVTMIECPASSPNYFYRHHLGEHLYFTNNLPANYTVVGAGTQFRDVNIALTYIEVDDATDVDLNLQQWPPDVGGSADLVFLATGNAYPIIQRESDMRLTIRGNAIGELRRDCTVMHAAADTFARYGTTVFVRGDAADQSGAFRIEHDGDTYNSGKDTGNNHTKPILKIGGERARTIQRHYAWLQFNWKHAFDGNANFVQLEFEVESSANIRPWLDFSSNGTAFVMPGDDRIIAFADESPDLSAVIGALSVTGTSWSRDSTTIRLGDHPDLSRVHEVSDGGDMAWIRLNGAGNGVRYQEWFNCSTRNDDDDLITTSFAPTNSGGGAYVIWNRDTDLMWLEGATGGDVPGLGNEYFTIAAVDNDTKEIKLNVPPGGVLTGRWNIGEPIGMIHKIHAEPDLNFISTTNSVGGVNPPSDLAAAWKTAGGDFRAFDKYIASPWSADVFFRLVPSSGSTLIIGHGSNSVIAGHTQQSQEADLRAIMQAAVDEGDKALGIMLRTINHAWDATGTYIGPPGAASFVTYKSSNDSKSTHWPELTIGNAVETN